jgi:hypothetical protein
VTAKHQPRTAILEIKNFRIEFQRPHLYPKQRAAIYEPKRISVIEASTKSGKTAGSIIWLLEQAFAGRPGHNFWWVAPVSDQSLIAFRRMLRALPQNAATANLSLRTLTLVNGAVIWFKSGDKPNSLYGEDVYAAVLDEASRMKEDAWIAVRSTVTFTKGKLRIIGNVKGRKNWAYRLARQAERGTDPQLGYHKIIAGDAVQAGVLSAKEIEDAKSQMPESAFRELYLAEASDDGGNPFGEQHVRACIVPHLSGGAPACWGWDLAKRQDYTVGIALDQSGYACRFERFHGIPWDEILKRIINVTGSVNALVDSTGVGDPIMDWLKKQPGARFEGYHFTPGSKQRLMEGLAVAIQSRAVTYPEGPIVQELLQFEYAVSQSGQVKYSAPEGYFDDCVVALSLALMCRQLMPGPVIVTQQVLQQVMAQARRRIY